MGSGWPHQPGRQGLHPQVEALVLELLCLVLFEALGLCKLLDQFWSPSAASFPAAAQPGSFPGGFVNEYNFTATKDRGRTESSGGKRALSFFPKSNFSGRNCFLRQTRTHMGPDLANASLFPREVLNYPPTKTLVEVQEL